jgi:hypothetical protein
MATAIPWGPVIRKRFRGVAAFSLRSMGRLRTEQLRVVLARVFGDIHHLHSRNTLVAA